MSFYEKLPKKRTTYIGIGMAFCRSLDVINGWITEFANKKRLYVKDLTEDLVWIYLIQLNNQQYGDGQTDDSQRINYFKRYEECQTMAFAAYNEVWEEVVSASLTTAEVDVRLDKAEHDEDFKGLTRFISSNIDSFKTAYARPRKYLADYISALFKADFSGESSSFTNLNRMRGFLDDSMVNYLSGDHNTINTYDWKNRKKTLNIKYIPKSRRFHISICLALGMTTDEINRYLDLMGYVPLREDDREENLLIRLLEEWEKAHPLQRAFKDRILTSGDTQALADSGSSFTEYTAFQEELLFLREEMYNGFKEQGVSFPYMNK
ncbi:MAG: hypothetical protein Q4A65_04195 [Bacillota bacterium]|nr:hypothetical protein [Bacillota bacterium]